MLNSLLSNALEVSITRGVREDLANAGCSCASEVAGISRDKIYWVHPRECHRGRVKPFKNVTLGLTVETLEM
jgi:hypothetical protein